MAGMIYAPIHYGSVEAMEAEVLELERKMSDTRRLMGSGVVERSGGREDGVYASRSSSRQNTRSDRYSELSSLASDKSTISEPIWRRPTRETPQEEAERLAEEKIQVQASIRRWTAYPLSNNAEKHESNVHAVTMDKRLADYVYSEDPLIFMPDLGAPAPSYPDPSAPSNAK